MLKATSRASEFVIRSAGIISHAAPFMISHRDTNFGCFDSGNIVVQTAIFGPGAGNAYLKIMMRISGGRSGRRRNVVVFAMFGLRILFCSSIEYCE
jgi:hypothetical protein